MSEALFCVHLQPLDAFLVPFVHSRAGNSIDIKCSVDPSTWETQAFSWSSVTEGFDNVDTVLFSSPWSWCSAFWLHFLLAPPHRSEFFCRNLVLLVAQIYSSFSRMFSRGSPEFFPFAWCYSESKVSHLLSGSKPQHNSCPNLSSTLLESFRVQSVASFGTTHSQLSESFTCLEFMSHIQELIFQIKTDRAHAARGV